MANADSEAVEGIGAADDDTADEKAVDEKAEHRRKRLAMMAAGLLGVATIFSAWGVYQSARWSGVMTIAFNEALTLNNDAGKLFAEGDAEYNLDQSLFVEVVVAGQQGDEELATYVQGTLFSDQLFAAYEAWLLTDEEGPDTPFEMEEYVVQQWQDGDALEAEAEALFDEARDANQTSDNYVLLTVAFASTLFFAGIAGTSRVYQAGIALFGIGCVVLVVAVSIMLTQPIH